MWKRNVIAYIKIIKLQCCLPGNNIIQSNSLCLDALHRCGFSTLWKSSWSQFSQWKVFSINCWTILNTVPSTSTKSHSHFLLTSYLLIPAFLPKFLNIWLIDWKLSGFIKSGSPQYILAEFFTISMQPKTFDACDTGSSWFSSNCNLERFSLLHALHILWVI